MGIGSIIDIDHLSQLPAGKKVIFGSGLRSTAPLADVIDETYEFNFVRGPMSAKVLTDLNVAYITDPAVLAPRLVKPGELSINKEPSTTRIGFVPYFSSQGAKFEKICHNFGLELISPKLDAKTFMEKLLSCDHIITEAMHGAILADAFRIPWIGCRIYSGLLEGPTSLFKWQDWLDSLGIETSIRNIFPGFTLTLPASIRAHLGTLANYRVDRFFEGILKEPNWTLSAPTRLKNAQDEILDRSEILKSVYT